MDNAFEWIVENGGVDSEKQYMYNATDIVQERPLMEPYLAADGFLALSL